MQYVHIKSIMNKVLEDLDLAQKREYGKICEFWEERVGKKIAGHSCPHSLTSRGKLLVNVDSSPWVEELTLFHKEKIKTALNELLGGKVIKEVFFRIGKVG